MIVVKIDQQATFLTIFKYTITTFPIKNRKHNLNLNFWPKYSFYFYLHNLLIIQTAVFEFLQQKNLFDGELFGDVHYFCCEILSLTCLLFFYFCSFVYFASIFLYFCFMSGTCYSKFNSKSLSLICLLFFRYSMIKA